MTPARGLPPGPIDGLGADVDPAHYGESRDREGATRAHLAPRAQRAGASRATALHALTTGQVIAQNLSVLVDGSLTAAIMSDERGAAITGGYVAWTATIYSGQPNNSYACDDWQSDSAGGQFGMLNYNNSYFTYYGVTGCSSAAHTMSMTAPSPP